MLRLDFMNTRTVLLLIGIKERWVLVHVIRCSSALYKVSYTVYLRDGSAQTVLHAATLR